MKYVAVGIICLGLAAWGGIANRHAIIIDLLSTGAPPATESRD